jgi:ADP-heptose:LPS heptosyltransferase
LGRTYTRDVVACSEYVDEFVNWDEIEKLSEDHQKVERFQELKADVIIHVFPQPEIAHMAKKAAIKTRIGTAGRIFHLNSCNKPVLFSRKRSELHEAQLNLKLLKPLGLTEIPKLQELSDFYGFSIIPVLDKQFVKLINPSKKNLILHPKSKGSAREWGLENFNSLIELLPENEYQIFVSGTEEEGKLFRDKLNLKKDNVTDISGTMSLQQFIAFITLCDGLVAASTGPLHIAAATGIIALGIYPPIKPMHPGRWAPIGKNAKYLVKEAECNDCRKGGGCHCMLEITPEQVKQKLEERF